MWELVTSLKLYLYCWRHYGRFAEGLRHCLGFGESFVIVDSSTQVCSGRAETGIDVFDLISQDTLSLESVRMPIEVVPGLEYPSVPPRPRRAATRGNESFIPISFNQIVTSIDKDAQGLGRAWKGTQRALRLSSHINDKRL